MLYEAITGNDNPNIHTSGDTTSVSGFSWSHSLEFAKVALAFLYELSASMPFAVTLIFTPTRNHPYNMYLQQDTYIPVLVSSERIRYPSCGEDGGFLISRPPRTVPPAYCDGKSLGS